MEWFCIAKIVVPENVSVSSNVGLAFGSVGFLDFYVDYGHCWGIELTCEGEKLNEHAKQFEGGGIYTDIPLNQWAILDFKKKKKNVRVPKQNFWYIILYSEDYKNVTIKRKDCIDLNITLKGDVKSEQEY